VTPDILQTVVTAIAVVKEMPEGEITLDRSFEDLGMDSLDGLNVIFELEKAFGIRVSTEDAMNVRGVRDIVEHLQRVLSGDGTTAPPV
jgi:acyl carrier protein